MQYEQKCNERSLQKALMIKQAQEREMIQQTREMAAEESAVTVRIAGDVEMKGAEEEENCLSDMMGQEEKSSTQAQEMQLPVPAKSEEKVIERTKDSKKQALTKGTKKNSKKKVQRKQLSESDSGSSSSSSSGSSDEDEDDKSSINYDDFDDYGKPKKPLLAKVTRFGRLSEKKINILGSEDNSAYLDGDLDDYGEEQNHDVSSYGDGDYGDDYGEEQYNGQEIDPEEAKLYNQIQIEQEGLRKMNFETKKPYSNKADREKPFILYLDSMNHASESLMQPLRSYIEMEYLEKKIPASSKSYFTEDNHWKGLSSATMPAIQPFVPRQQNSFDCGLFLLEYAEIFMENEDFILNNLKQEGVELFKEEWIDYKREIIKRLIISLAKGTSTGEIGQKYI